MSHFTCKGWRFEAAFRLKLREALMRRLFYGLMAASSFLCAAPAEAAVGCKVWPSPAGKLVRDFDVPP